MKKLKDIALIKSGYSFRCRLRPSRHGNIAVIKMGDLSQNLNKAMLDRIDMQPVNLKHLVRKNDIILCPRGESNLATLVVNNFKDTIAVAPLMIIRLNQDADVIPAYLCWYINQPKTQSWFRSHARGSAMQLIGKTIIENLEIPIMPIAKQSIIASLFKLVEQEKELNNKLAHLYKACCQTASMDFIMNYSQGKTK